MSDLFLEHLAVVGVVVGVVGVVVKVVGVVVGACQIGRLLVASSPALGRLLRVAALGHAAPPYPAFQCTLLWLSVVCLTGCLLKRLFDPVVSMVVCCRLSV